MINKIRLPLVLALMMFAWILPAQQILDTKQHNIFETLATDDSATHASVNIHQDKRIELLLASKRNVNPSANSSRGTNTISGFRVQVFSSNTQRTAKNEAFQIEKQIREEFPDQAIYVNYTSPFWKVRVGDFRSHSEAQAFRSDLIEAFPHMRSEIYTVRDQILTSVSK